MQRKYDEIVARGAEVLAISMDNLNGAESIAGRVGISFPILYTSGDSTVPRAYDAYNRHNDGLAAPAVFIIDKDGKIVWERISRVYQNRVDPNTVLANLP